SRDQFAPHARLATALGTERGMCGFNLVRPALGGTLTLTVRPTFQDGDMLVPANTFDAKFNYHIPVHGADNPTAAAEATVRQVLDAKTESEQMSISILATPRA